MAPTYYLAIDGLYGNAQDPGHQGWFAISGYAFDGFTQASYSAGGPVGVTPATFGPLEVAFSGTGLPAALTNISKGAAYKSIRLVGVNQAGVTVYDLNLGNVLVNSFDNSGGGGTNSAFLTFSYQQIALTTTAVNPDGSAGAAQYLGFDTSTQTVIDPAAIPAPVIGASGGEVVDGNITYYLAIDKQDGGVLDAKHLAWFQVSQFDFAASGNASSPAFGPLQVAFGGSGLVNPFSFLLKDSSITAVQLEGVDGHGVPVYDLILNNVHITSYDDNTTNGATLTFDYKEFGLTTTADSNGTAGASTSFGLDLTTGGSIDATQLTLPAPDTHPALVGPPDIAGYSEVVPAGLTYFLAIDGLDGGYQNPNDPAHAGWFQVSGYDFSASNPSGNAALGPLQVLLQGTGLTEALAAVAVGSQFKSVKIEGVDGTGKAVYDLKLGTASVASYQATNTAGSLSFSYQTVELSSAIVDTNGKPNQYDFGWDVVTNSDNVPPVPDPVPGTADGNVVPGGLTYFLAINGLDGGATNPAASGKTASEWFAISTYDLAGSSSAGGTTFSPLTVTFAGTEAALLADLPFAGDNNNSIELQGVNGAGQVGYDLLLGDAWVTGYNDSNGLDTLTFSYRDLGLTTTVNVNGTPASQSTGYDTVAKTAIDPGTIAKPVLPAMDGRTLDQGVTYFLATDGVGGDSLSPGHTGWFAVSSYDLSAGNTVTFAPEPGQDLESLPSFSSLSVTLDSTGLPAVLGELATGRLITSVRLEGVDASGTAVTDLTLGKALVTSYGDSSSGATLSFGYQQIELQTVTGTPNQPETFTYDFNTEQTDKTVIPAPTPSTAGGDVAGSSLTYFLAIDGLDGGSLNANHQHWFEVSGYQIGALSSAPAGGAAGGSPATASFGALTVDLSGGLSEELSSLAEGTNFISARLEGVSGSGVAVYDLTLGNVFLTDYNDSSGSAQVSLSYQQFLLQTTAASGGASQSFGFDTVTDRQVTWITAPTPGTTPVLTINGGSATPIGAAGAASVAFTLTGLATGDSGTVTFTDVNGASVQVNVAGSQQSYSVNLSALTDGPISALFRDQLFKVPGSVTLAQNDHWTAAASGDWSVAADWSAGVPTGNVDAVIDAAGAYTVKITTTATAYGTTVDASGATVNDTTGGALTLVGPGGTAAPDGVLSIAAGTFELSGGSLNAAAISVASGATLLAAGAKPVTLTGNISDAGAIIVRAKKATFDGTISGSGKITIASGASAVFGGAISGSGVIALTGSANLELGATDSKKVTFEAGADGILTIDHSTAKAFTGKISGLTAANAVDLADLTFTAGKMTATFSGTAAGGTLTVKNAATKQTALLKLSGDYLSSTWNLSQDTSGRGTLVVDPAAASAALLAHYMASTFTGTGAANNNISATGSSGTDAPFLTASPH
jgi:hypothetical protein